MKVDKNDHLDETEGQTYAITKTWRAINVTMICFDETSLRLMIMMIITHNFPVKDHGQKTWDSRTHLKNLILKMPSPIHPAMYQRVYIF